MEGFINGWLRKKVITLIDFGLGMVATLKERLINSKHITVYQLLAQISTALFGLG